MKSFSAMVGAVVATSSSSNELKFMEYITQFGKSYATIAEYQFRFEQFARNHNEVMNHNADSSKSFLLGYNKMSDWTTEEYRNLLTFIPMSGSEIPISENLNTAEVSPVDWVAAGAVNQVKD
jgi:hypothetical protein